MNTISPEESLVTKQTNKFIFIFGMLIGVICFILLYGIQILDFTYIDWLYAGEDLTQHFLGWEFFRKSAWSFPYIGLIEGVVYPAKISVLYSDSIPIFAILFKAISPILPAQFQYFGLWGLMCFALQGGISSLLIYRVTARKDLSIIGSILFVLSPVLLDKMFRYTSLSAHWLILLGILICFAWKDATYKKRLAAWTAIISISAMVHCYFIPMIGILLLYDVAQNHVVNKEWKKAIMMLAIPGTAGLICMFFIGAFYGGVGIYGGGVGDFGFNLNAFFNSYGWSQFLPTLPTATDGQYEGFAYLGIGGMILLAAGLLWYGYKVFCQMKNKALHITFAKALPYLLVLAYLLISMMTRISFNDVTLLYIKLPHIPENVISIFRSCGRFIWPLWYLILFFSLKQLAEYPFKKLYTCVFAVGCMALQLLDLSGAYSRIHQTFASRVAYVTSLTNQIWKNLGGGQNAFKHIIIVDDFYRWGEENQLDMLYDISIYAAESNLTLNDTYLARKDGKRVDRVLEEELEYVKTNGGRADTIYIFDADTEHVQLLDQLATFYADGYVIGISKEQAEMLN